MANADINEIYARHIKSLSADDRKELLAMLARDLAVPAEKQRTRNLMELEGVGAELWEGLDAQEYVNELRQEWDHRP